MIKISEKKIEDFLNWEFNNKWEEILIKDFPIYHIIRNDLFTIFFFSNSNIDLLKYQVKDQSNVSLIRKITSLAFAFWGVFKKEKVNKSKIIGFSSARNVEIINKIPIDKFLDPLLGNIDIKGQKTILEVPNYEGVIHKGFFRRKINSVYPFDILYFLEAFTKNEIYDIENDIHIILKSFLNLYNSSNEHSPTYDLLFSFCLAKINKNLNRLRVYTKFLDRSKPSFVFVTSFYSPQSMVLTHIFNRKGTITFEVQHSHIYPNHFGYIMSKTQSKLSITPNYFLVQGNYYQNLLNRYIKNDRIIISGLFEFLKKTNEIKIKSNILRNSSHKNILIINQFTVSSIIFDFLKESNNYPDYCFYIKLHPVNLEDQLNVFKKIGNNSNVKIVRKENFYKLCSIMDGFISIYSTGLIETLQFNKPTFRLYNQLYTQLDDLVDKNYIMNISTIDEFNLKFLEFKKDLNFKPLYSQLKEDSILNYIL